MATLINNKAVEATGMANRGVKTQNFAIIRDTKMKACLIECGFMDNEHDTPLILTEEYATEVARGIADGILTYLNIENKEETKVESKPQEPIKQVEEKRKIDVKYQVYANGKWYSDIINFNDKNDMGYAGVFGQAVNCFRRKYSAEMKQM